MELKRLSRRVWLSPFDDARDRPSLGYLKGDKLTLAVDAGHSKAHVEEFYDALRAEGLPLPDLTVATHWHWDHTFAIPFVHGLTVAGERTQTHLREVVDHWDDRGGERYFKELDEHIALEYGDAPITVSTADLTFGDRLTLDLGGLTVECFHLVSPHTDDSTFLLVPEEKLLFLGDAISGAYPNWIADPEKRKAQIAELEKLDFQTAVGGHWAPFTKAGLLRSLRDGNF